MSPPDVATVYTILVALIVGLTLFTAWCLDRIAEGKKRERELREEISRMRREAKQGEWIPRGPFAEQSTKETQ